MREKEHWRLVLDPETRKYQPDQQDLAWVGPETWRKVTPHNPDSKP